MIPQVKRRIFEVAIERVDETPVLLLEGPRGVGKSTLLQEVAASTGLPVFDLDQGDYRALAESNPNAIVGEATPVYIDEYQRVPALLDEIKARLNAGARHGMFVLAGSASFDSLPKGTQALTGRIQRLAVHPFAQTELDGSDNRFIERAFDGDIEHDLTQAATTRLGYAERVLRGGMPLALAAKTDTARGRWFAGHIRQSLDRDAGELRRIGKRTELGQLLTRTAGQTAGVLNMAKAAEGLNLNENTAASYVELLEALFLIQRLPAWGTTLMPRAMKSPKIHVVDSGIGGHLLRLNMAKLERREPSAMTEYGHLLESFVVQEVLRQVSWLDHLVTPGHWRTRDGAEVDLVLERDDGIVVAIEVKAGDSVKPDQLSGLRALRDRLGSSFAAGIVFHAGRLGHELEDRLHSLPIERLWK